MILLEQSFTAHMPLLTATTAFELGSRLHNGVTCTASVPPKNVTASTIKISN